MTARVSAVLLMIVLWAALYLPFLGSSELRGEEGKRVLPAVQMLDRGNYLVPHLGVHPYLNKPPLINWLVAASFRTFGIRNEWSARLPSAIFVLLSALALVLVGRVTWGAAGSTIAGLGWLTTLELIDKGRTIETDAINASLFALALVFWLSFWQRNRSPWMTFTFPWIFLGLGFLVKGPGLLLFFYAVAIAVAWRTRRLRELFHPAHALGILIMLAIVAAWAVPFFLAIRSDSLGQVWSHELAAILFGEKGRSENWALNFPRGIAFFLPSVLLLPFVRFNKIENLVEREMARGLAWGSLVPFLGVLLLPGTAPRYVLPLASPLCLLIGLVAANDAFVWRVGKFRVSEIFVKWAAAAAILVEIIVIPARSAALAKKHQVLKPIATRINEAMPADAPLYAIDQGYQPFLFYVRAPVLYLSTLEALPPDGRFFLIQSRDLDEMKLSERWQALQPTLLARTNLFRSNDTMLFTVTKHDQ